jgi:hypothetical protein
MSFRTPAAASRRAPVHTESSHSTLVDWPRIQAMSPSCFSSGLVPYPPGMTRMSACGQLSIEYCGATVNLPRPVMGRMEIPTL